MSAYLTAAEADDYFASRFGSNRWAAQQTATKESLLLAATKAIDRLNFAGLKAAAYTAKLAGADRVAQRAAAESQVNQFPRNEDTIVPQDILDACCEIAYALLSGYDPDQELRKLATASESVGPLGLKVTYDRSRAQDWVMAGIASPTAWQMLMPYLRDLRAFNVRRV
jgi:hypothetical protein